MSFERWCPGVLNYERRKRSATFMTVHDDLESFDQDGGSKGRSLVFLSRKTFEICFMISSSANQGGRTLYENSLEWKKHFVKKPFGTVGIAPTPIYTSW